MTTLILTLVISLLIAFAIYIYIHERRKKPIPPPPPIDHYPKYFFDDFDLAIINLINEYRRANKLNVLIPDSRLARVSNSHSVWMSKNIFTGDDFKQKAHYFAQSRFDQFPGRRTSENVAYNYITAGAVVKAWIKSTKHNKNLLNPKHNYIGLSNCKGDNGRNYFCCMFMD